MRGKPRTLTQLIVAVQTSKTLLLLSVSLYQITLHGRSPGLYSICNNAHHLRVDAASEGESPKSGYELVYSWGLPGIAGVIRIKLG